MSADRWDARTRLLLGDEAAERLAHSRVAVVGLGGVGGYAAEILVRTGVGTLILVDHDTVSITNLNRQLIALRDNVGLTKTALWSTRAMMINRDIDIVEADKFIDPDNVHELIDQKPDFIVDAIDTVAPKCALIAGAVNAGIPIISSMGSGGRLDPTAVCYSDLWNTRDDGLARAVRTRLRKAGMDSPVPVVCSTELPKGGAVIGVEERNKVSSYGTTAAVPAIFGIYLAQYVIRKLTGK